MPAGRHDAITAARPDSRMCRASSAGRVGAWSRRVLILPDRQPLLCSLRRGIILHLCSHMLRN